MRRSMIPMGLCSVSGREFLASEHTLSPSVCHRNVVRLDAVLTSFLLKFISFGDLTTVTQTSSSELFDGVLKLRVNKNSWTSRIVCQDSLKESSLWMGSVDLHFRW